MEKLPIYVISYLSSSLFGTLSSCCPTQGNSRSFSGVHIQSKFSHTDIGSTDTIRIQDIALTIWLGSGSCWPAKQPHEGTLQPVHVTLSLMHDVKEAAETDDLTHSINYSDLAKELRGSIRNEPVFASLEEFSLHTYDALLQKNSLLDKYRGKVSGLGICVVQLRPPLHCARVGVESAATFNEDTWTVTRVSHFVDGLTCHAIIGVNPGERVEKQDVVSSISIDSGKDGLQKEQWIDFRAIARMLYEVRCFSLHYAVINQIY